MREAIPLLEGREGENIGRNSLSHEYLSRSCRLSDHRNITASKCLIIRSNQPRSIIVFPLFIREVCNSLMSRASLAQIGDNLILSVLKSDMQGSRTEVILLFSWCGSHMKVAHAIYRSIVFYFRK